MAVLLWHRRAPEVVAEKAEKVWRGSEVFVVLDGADIIEDEIAKVCVAVDDDNDGQDDDREVTRSPE